MNRRQIALALGLLFASAAWGYAQGETSFDRFLFPPELVMQHQGQISLTESQRTTITESIKQLQAKVVDFQWQIQAETQKLEGLLASPSVDAEAALQQIDRLLGIEREVKKLHLSTLIRIKNTLTPEQQKQLQQLRPPPQTFYRQQPPR